ncbi:MAG: c-type cytochrome biogenesis protein CcsB [Bacteroidetes bacterium]|nr:c-type cytochrome biogenesis protein CcsB [Bacteroidota bacterium]
MQKVKKVFLFSPWFMGVLFILFALAMAFATFFENDYGAQVARILVYESKWFELIMLLLVINFIGQIFYFKLYHRKKLTILIFHLALVMMIIGAGMTRYLGFEGTIHIREGQEQNICKSKENYVKVNVLNTQEKLLFSDDQKMMVTHVKSDRYKNSFLVEEKKYRLEFKKHIPNVTETLIDVENGKPSVALIISNKMMERESVLLSEGDIKNVKGIIIGFGKMESADVNITYQNNSFQIQSDHGIQRASMGVSNSKDAPNKNTMSLERMKLYEIENLSIVAQNFTTSGEIQPIQMNYNIQLTNKSVLVFELSDDVKSTDLYVWTGEGIPHEAIYITDKYIFKLSYAPKEIELPFKIKLEDFILDRYPGSSSPSSYKSKVVLIDDQNNIKKPYSIYMNHILKYKGWRFYQSSYDQDEKGTTLSVNKDFWGMAITYTGYFLLFLFIILSVLNKNSNFRKVGKNYFSSKAGKMLVMLLMLVGASFLAQAQNQKLVVNKETANQFGKVLVQDQKGRTEPVYTLSHDILRKVSRSVEYNGYNPMQVFLGFYFDFENWQNEALIKVSNKQLKRILGIAGNHAAFSDIVNLKDNTYKLKPYLDAAYSKPSGARNKFDKEIIKVDERINICYMIHIGEFMKIFPVHDPNNKWYSPKDAYQFAKNADDSLYLKNIMILNHQTILNDENNKSGEYLNSIINYQRKFAQYDLPSESKINAEIFYYKSKIYERLFPYYTALGFILLVILIFEIVAQKKNFRKTLIIFKVLLIIGFLFHTLGLAIRWYVSGHAPMSNGYESMIFISWVTILAGFIFSKRSALVLAATSVLGGFTLMVAHLSFMDPEITNLVPVLQSYWLTLHVSVITSSYGFLGLGAILAIIVLILYSLISVGNKSSIHSTIEELTIINYKSLTIGLYLLTIGTFLGAIWANESWGRYWGWDPKETWSLITIIVYSFIIHSRMIPGLKGYYSFNLMALFGFSSVLMTYFGVNYYLTGLHSYAGGDSIPVPNFVYLSVVLIVTLSLFAHWKKKIIVKEH